MADYTFKVDLKHDGNTLQNSSDILNTANTKTMYLPINLGGHPIKKLKHGDTFVLSGVLGKNLKNLIEQQRVFNVVLQTEESEEEEVFNGQLFACRDDGIYSLTFNDSFLSIGGREYFWSEELLPDGGYSEINDVAIATDGQYNYVIINNYNAQYSLIKIDANGESTLINVPDLSGEDVGNINSLTYIGDNKLALLSDDIYTVFTTSGEVIVQKSSMNFEDIDALVYFEDEVYGVGYGNCLYAVDKDTGEIFGEEISQEVKRSRTLAWKEDSAFQVSINDTYQPFIYNGRFFSLAYSYDDYLERLIEIFPNTNEMTHIDFCEISVAQIGQLTLTANRSNEMGYSIDDYLSYVLSIDFEVYQYDGEMWVDQNVFYKEPTISNLILQYGDQTAFYNSEDPGWETATITGVSFDEDDLQWIITFTGNDSDNDIMRIRYADGSGNFWTYVDED